MAFTFSAALANYNDRRYDIIRNLEEPGGVPHFEVYVDSSGYPTIGAGFKVDSWAETILRNMSLTGVGIEGTNFTRARNAISTASKGKTFANATAAQTAINDAMNSALGLTGAARLVFAFSSNTQVRTALDEIADTFELQVSNWLGTVIPKDRELITLTSLAYNNIIGERRDTAGNFLGWKSPTLRQAMIDGDRAKAWFEIRYDSNGNHLDGIAKRRFYESSLFGLYADSTAVTKVEAYNVYRMVTEKRDTIVAYEKKYGQWQDASGTYLGVVHNNVYDAGVAYASVIADLPDGEVSTIAVALVKAKEKLILELNNSYAGLSLDANNFLSTAVQVAQDKGSKLNGLVKNSAGVEVASNDLLVGGSGNDTLVGGKGDDILIGGAGGDTYVYKAGDGNDRIIDDGVGDRIVINGTENKAVGGFFFHDSNGPTNTWRGVDGSITITHNSPYKIVLADGSTIQLGAQESDFQSGDYGIRRKLQGPGCSELHPPGFARH